MIKRHRKLAVWQKAIELTEHIYVFSACLPAEERFGLTSQMRRCSVSIPSNIAEGAARHSDKEFLRFLNIAKGSLAELETQMILCSRLYTLNWDYEQTQRRIEDVFALNEALRRHLLRSINSQASSVRLQASSEE
jgi:four helix bundle protein